MSGQQSEGRAEAVKLQKLASKKRFDELEAAWTEAIESDAVEPGDLFFVLDTVMRGGDAEQADSLLWFLLTDRAERKGAVDALNIARSAAESFPQSAVLREELLSLYRAAHADIPEIGTFAEITISQEDVPLPAAVQRIEKLLVLRPGTCVLDAARDEVGRVAGFDGDTKTVEVSFEEGARAYDAASTDDLELLAADDFRALFIFEPEKLSGLAEDDPGELVTRVLRAFGPRLTFGGLRSRLAGVVPKDAWSKWWAMAKPRLQRAPWVEMSEKAQPTFALRSTPIAYEDILKAQFNGASSSEEKLVVVLDYLGETAGGAGANPGLLEFFGAQLAKLSDTLGGAEPAAAIGALALTRELHTRLPDRVGAPGHELEPLLSDKDLSTLMRPIRNDKLARLVLAFARDALPSRWCEVYAALMPGCSPAGCGLIAGELSAAGRAEDVRDAVARILAYPDRYASALTWLWRVTCAGGVSAIPGEVDRVAVALALFSAAASLGRGASRSRPDRQHLLSQVRAAVSARDYEPLREVLAGADEHRLRRIKDSVERHTGLSESACQRVHEILRRAHPDLFVEHVEPWQEDAVYSTEAGLRRRQEQLSHLVTVKLVEASKAVGKAAEMGDLSENAEWTAALQERDRLATRAEQMQEDINKVRIITHEMAESESVTVGSTVQARDLKTGQVETYTFLGPWDADHDEGVYSYQAKLGLAFMGKSVGDRVTLQADRDERAWEIVEVRPAM